MNDMSLFVRKTGHVEFTAPWSLINISSCHAHNRAESTTDRAISIDKFYAISTYNFHGGPLKNETGLAGVLLIVLTKSD